MAIEPIRAILDVDTGLDDAMAIAMAVHAPSVQLLGITTVAGNVGLKYTTQNTLRVLAFLGATVPVYRGMSRPLDRPAMDAAWVHGEDGLGGAQLPPATQQPEAISAPQFLIDAARQSPGELTFIFVGPLTNLAIAVALEPELPRLVQRLVIMGGAFRVPGNDTPVAEFNIAADPQAAAQVLAAGFNATWVGLDVTAQTVLARDQYDALADAQSPPARLVRMVAQYAFEERGVEAFQLHDPLAVGVAMDPTLVDAPEEAMAIETALGFTAGQTVIERRKRPSDWTRTRVARTVERERFVALFADTLGLPHVSSPST